MDKDKNRLILIDGNSLMFRAYFATAYRGNFMQTSKGLYTNAIYGFYGMTNKIFTTEEYTFVAFDAGSQTFRHKQFVDYKATRKPLAEELRVQIPYVKRYLDILKVKRLESLDYEADDILASAAFKFYDDFDEIVIVSGDKDLLQLVNGKVKVLVPLRGTSEFDEFNSDNFYEKVGYYPNQVIDYKGMVGDPSDNLPGIKGIGSKTAIKLLAEYNTLENMIDHSHELKGKMQENVQADQELALNSKYLATLKKDFEIDYTVEDLRLEPLNYPELVDFLKELEFNSFLKELNRKEVQAEIDFEIIQDINYDFENILNLDSYLNMEVFGENYYSGEFLGISLVNKNGNYFLPKSVVLQNKEVKRFLESTELKKKVYDYKKFLVVLNKYGIGLNNVDFDLMISAYLINPNFGVGDFKKVIENFGEYPLSYYDNIYGANTKMKVPSLEIYAKYSVQKSLALQDIELEINKQIKDLDLEYLNEIEMELARVLAMLEVRGLKVDSQRLAEIGEDLSSRIEVLEKEIHELAGIEFNVNSPKQLGEVLFERLHLPHGKKNKTGFSTNVDVLEKLASDFPIARKVLDYRGLNKLITTYVNGISEFIDGAGFIHPLYKQTETKTGRLSSFEPNIQNIPIRTEEGQVIREIFISRFENGVILSLDYSQIELRVLAHLSNDPVMLDSFNNSIDFHSQTASRIYEVDLAAVTPDMRRVAKAINFGIIYGMSAWGLSEQIDISPLEANIYINKYFDTFKEAKRYLDSLVENVKETGYTTTILSRRRYIPEATSKNKNLRAFGERTAMNAPIQGSAADIIKIAMVNVARRIQAESLESLMIAQVHDELLFDCPATEVDLLEKIVKDEMEKAYKLNVKLEVGTARGKTWAEAK